MAVRGRGVAVPVRLHAGSPARHDAIRARDHRRDGRRVEHRRARDRLRSACETFSSSVSGPDAGGSIDVDLTLVHTGEPICILIAVPVDETITIGPLPAGAYVVRVAGTEWPVAIA